MTNSERIEPQLAPLTLEWDEHQAWLRGSDRVRAEGLIHALMDESANVLISAEHPGVLDHYSRLLVRRLRQEPNLHIEVVFATTTEVLLQRFNQWLASVPLQQAREAPLHGAPVRVLVVNDGGAVQQSELQVMARLALDFPGVNVRLVLVMDEGPEVSTRRALLGKRHVHWRIAMPDMEEVQHLLEQTPHHQRPALLAWLRDLGAADGSKLPDVARGFAPLQGRAVPTATAQTATDSAKPNLRGHAAPPLPEPSPAWPDILPLPDSTSQPKSKNKWAVGLILVSLVLSSVLVLSWYRADTPEILKKLEFDPIPQSG